MDGEAKIESPVTQDDSFDKNRMRVLERIERGEISPDEGARLLSEMVAQSDEASSHGQTASEEEAIPTPPSHEEIERWRRWWRIPLWVGFGVTVLAGIFLFRAFEAGVFWLGFNSQVQRAVGRYLKR